MHRPQRLRSVVDGRRMVLALGALYVALAVAHPFAPFVADEPISADLVVGIVAGGTGLVLLGVGYCLPRLDVRPDVYPVVARWCLRGIGAMALLIGLVALVAQVDSVVQNVLILTGMGAVAGVVAGVHDGRAKSRQRELEEAVERLERANERLSQFTYATSHDLQEPLRMVSSYLQLLDSRYGNDLDEEAREYLDFAVGGADRMRAMVASLHEYAQVSPAEAPHERTDAGAVLDDVLDDLDKAIDDTEATVTADALPTVTADSRQLSHLFRNLLSNALRFSGDEAPQVHVSATRVDADGQPVDSDEPSDDGDGQPVEAGGPSDETGGPSADAGGPSDETGGVSTGADGGTAYADEVGGRSEDPDDHPASASSEDEWRFAVTDHGVGIDPEFQDRLFGPFEQFHASDGPGQEAGGTGLALCERIVERHGGDIWVESEPGEGSTFYFTLPVASMDRAERPLDPPAAE